jgi:hypothetical protein
MRSIAFGIATAACVAASASAGLVNPLIPGWAGTAQTTSAAWESFTQANGGANLPDQAGSAPYSLMNFAPGATITGSGNLYGAGSALYIMIMGGTLGNAASPTELVMNVATAGSLLNTSSVRLSLFDNAGNFAQYAPSASELRADAPSPPQGSAQTWAFTWSLPNPTFAATGFRIEFLASAQFMALDAVRIDANFTPIPAPGAFMLLAGAGALVARRRRAN